MTRSEALNLEDLLSTWQRDGWLHLPGFWEPREVERVDQTLERLWCERPRAITVDDVDGQRRCRMSDLDPAARVHRVKVNDLYLQPGAVRGILLEPRLVELVAALLGDAPVLCNSLNLERGSGQEYHADGLFMTPLSPGRLVACWIALEDVRAGSGPLRLYPGSHLLPPFTFSDGGRHALPGELPRWAEATQRELDARGLRPETVYARAGDLILWHADLVHGAEPIGDRSLTRRSLVGHYFGHADCRRRGYRLVREERGYWLKRRPQPAGLLDRVLSAIERREERMRALVHRFI